MQFSSEKAAGHRNGTKKRVVARDVVVAEFRKVAPSSDPDASGDRFHNFAGRKGFPVIAQ